MLNDPASLPRADSDTGLRCQHQESMGRTILLFARMRADLQDKSFWFLGPATYVRHERERPMAIT